MPPKTFVGKCFQFSAILVAGFVIFAALMGLLFGVPYTATYEAHWTIGNPQSQDNEPDVKLTFDQCPSFYIGAFSSSLKHYLESTQPPSVVVKIRTRRDVINHKIIGYSVESIGSWNAWGNSFSYAGGGGPCEKDPAICGPSVKHDASPWCDSIP